MQQRRLRLGDIIDDYCPRERRLTNHAVVAKIDDEVRQTRCLTCDTEHEYRQGKAPTLRKKKDNVSAAYHEVLAEVTKGAPPAAEVEPVAVQAGDPADDTAPELPEETTVEPHPAEVAPAAASGENGPVAPEGPQAIEAARVHRRLIRATLPRPENQPVARPIPEFTMRQPTGRAAKFRPASSRGPRAAAGARAGASAAGRGFPARGGAQHAARPGRADGPRRGAQQPRHGGKKHSK